MKSLKEKIEESLSRDSEPQSAISFKEMLEEAADKMLGEVSEEMINYCKADVIATNNQHQWVTTCEPNTTGVDNDPRSIVGGLLDIIVNYPLQTEEKESIVEAIEYIMETMELKEKEELPNILETHNWPSNPVVYNIPTTQVIPPADDVDFKDIINETGPQEPSPTVSMKTNSKTPYEPYGGC